MEGWAPEGEKINNPNQEGYISRSTMAVVKGSEAVEGLGDETYASL